MRLFGIHEVQMNGNYKFTLHFQELRKSRLETLAVGELTKYDRRKCREICNMILNLISIAMESFKIYICPAVVNEQTTNK